jgi:excisionase family DNA binding protein
MATPLQSEWLTVEEAAAYLKVKPRSLLLWIRQSKLPAYALSGTRRRVWRLLQRDLDSALRSKPVVSSESSSSVRSEDRRKI